MAKRPLTPLSSLIPLKGEAARPEQLPQASAMQSEEERLPIEPKKKEDREGLTIRVLRSDNRRLRDMSFKTEWPKQALLDRAIKEFLDRYGF